jgi:hypothetical protein
MAPAGTERSRSRREPDQSSTERTAGADQATEPVQAATNAAKRIKNRLMDSLPGKPALITAGLIIVLLRALRQRQRRPPNGAWSMALAQLGLGVARRMKAARR